VPANAGLVLDHLGVSRENLKGVLFEGVWFNVLLGLFF
jgi:hypothetical protein